MLYEHIMSAIGQPLQREALAHSPTIGTLGPLTSRPHLLLKEGVFDAAVTFHLSRAPSVKAGHLLKWEEMVSGTFLTPFFLTFYPPDR